MVVDDDPLILRLCSLILSKNAVDHVTFQDPQESLDAVADDKITHIFLDIRMPSINGVELCHELRKKYSANVRFIALTAHVLKEEKDSILREGFDAILSKPFREFELTDALRATGVQKPKLPSFTPDLTALRQMTLNDESLFQSVLSQFIEETSGDIKTLKNLLHTHDTRSTRDVVHRLSGRLSQIGIGSLGSRFHEIESQIVAGRTSEELHEEIAEILRKLDELITHLRLTTPEHLN